MPTPLKVGASPGKKDKVAKTPVEATPAAPAAPNAVVQKKPLGDDFVLPLREVVKPDNQLHLSDKEREEEFAKMLTANNPAAPKNVARFNMKERTYKFEPMVDQLMVHYATDGWLLHKGSDEARRQAEAERHQEEAAARFQAEMDRASTQRHDEGTDTAGPDDSRQLRNQFNFSERAAQTFNYPLRDRATSTEPPPTATMSGTCTQWAIYDAYLEDQERQRLHEELTKAKNAKKGAGAADGVEPSAKEAKQEEKQNTLHSQAVARAAKVLERMGNQNSYIDIAMDFKYWDDPADAIRQGEGTLLPLWKFACEQARRKHVTAICWNPQYTDFFAVGYGSYDFLRQSSGLVACFSIKNPSYPEFIFTTDSGVMCVDFHPQHASLLAVGCYDGAVMVFDVRAKVNKPLYVSTPAMGKHTDPVWQIFWQESELQKQLQLTSVASDGRVTLWTLAKAELVHQDLMELKLQAATNGKSRDEDPTPGALAAGCCFDFNKAQDALFLVGSEEGQIHKCSKAYNSEYLQTYEGHHMAVYAVKWNQLHPSTFLSASADWTVKLWDSNRTRSIMTFDLNNPVGDVAWSPYSATTFAAVTDDGRVHVFDLHENKLEPLCEQKIVKKAKLTKICFSAKHPIILVGDDRGCVTSLKLSPNLRKGSKADSRAKLEELEMAKLNHVMDIALKGEVAGPEDA